jgi:hypothetical protein
MDQITSNQNVHINNDRRDELLIKMYDQLWNSINSHILVVWQSIGTVFGAFAILSLVEKSLISVHLAAAAILGLCLWLIANVYDASHWYNRNLAMIRNIEVDFLSAQDTRLISFYSFRTNPKKMIAHLKIQLWLEIILTLSVSTVHLIGQVIPYLNNPDKKSIDPFEISLPYLILLVGIIILTIIKKGQDKEYNAFLINSPGKPIVQVPIADIAQKEA